MSATADRTPGEVPMDECEVRAAGGVIWRRRRSHVEVVVVHRPRYDDWTFPKGKLEPRESFREAAIREVLEETGLDVVLGDELPPITYRDNRGRSKVVRYWTMTVTGGDFAVNDEVDELVWLRVGKVADRLTYDRDRPVFEAFIQARGKD